MLFEFPRKAIREIKVRDIKNEKFVARQLKLNTYIRPCFTVSIPCFYAKHYEKI